MKGASTDRARSWLYASGNSEKLLARVFEQGADAVILDLEDAVAPDRKTHARALVAEALVSHPAWVRINAPRTHAAEADLRAVAAHANGIRIPKVDSPEDVAWVLERIPGLPVTCTLETARGVLAAPSIARVQGVAHLNLGLADLSAELEATPSSETIAYARSQLVLASSGAGIARPIDSVYLGPDDEEALRQEAIRARDAGFFGKSCVRPWQVPVVNEAFTPTEAEVAWARNVLDHFEAAGEAATRLETGELVDAPVASRARALLRSVR